MTTLASPTTPVLAVEPQARRWNRDEYYRMGDIGLFQDQRTELIEGEVLVNGVERRWTRDEFYRMADIGLFRGQRAELIEGEIMVLSPQKAEHFTATDRVAEILRNAFGSGYHIRMQGPLGLGPNSEPEPDIAAVVGSREQYATRHPQSAVLIVEVSDTTLASDRTRKASLYARAGIADYWIVNLVNHQLEVRRTPVPEPSQAYGYGYEILTALLPPAVVSPLAAPQVNLTVAELVNVTN